MTIPVECEAEKVLDSPYWEIIEDAALTTLDYEGCPYEAKVNVILANNDAIQKISREYRQIDVPTDVLSFPMMDYGSPSDFDHVEEAVESYFSPKTGEPTLGGTVIFVDKVEKQAEKYSHSQVGELAFLTVHSILHPFGYGHTEDGEWLVMEKKQKEILETRRYTR